MRQKQEFSLTLGDRRLPFDIHSLAINDHGMLVGADRRDFAFRFVYRDIPFSVRYHEDEAEVCLDIVGDVGPLPFSAEQLVVRRALTAIIDAAQAHLGEVFMIAKGRIHLAGSPPITKPVTAVGLVSAITAFLLPANPYLETIALFRQQQAAVRGGAMRAGKRRA